MKKKKFVIVSEDGIIGSKGVKVDEVLAMLLHAFLCAWDRDKYSIDIVNAGEGVIDMLAMYKKEEKEDPIDELGEMLANLFGADDDDEDEGEDDNG